MHRVLKKVEGMNKEDLFGLILKRYSDVCGDYGKKSFEEKVLPKAYEVFKDTSLLVLELYRVIKISGKCKMSKIEEYLLRVVSEFNE